MKTKVQKVWSVTWKTLAGIVLLMCVIGGGLLLNAYVHSWDFRHRYGSESVEIIYPANASSFMVEYKWKNYYRAIDATTGQKLTPKLQFIYTSFVPDTLTVFIDRKGKRGYLNAYTGKIAIPAQYEHAWIFSEGLGAVVKDGKLGFIDHNGNWVVEPQFRYAGETMQYVFRNGLCTVKNQRGLFGVIDTKGEFVLEPIYSLIRHTEKPYRLVEIEGQYGLFIDSLRQFAYACEYDRIALSDEGITLTRNGRKWMVSHDLETVVYPFLFDEQGTFAVYLDEEDDYGNRKHYAYQPIGYYQVHHRLGLLNRQTGLPITPAIYSDIQYVSPNLFDCEFACDHDGEHIFINAKGERIE